MVLLLRVMFIINGIPLCQSKRMETLGFEYHRERRYKSFYVMRSQCVSGTFFTQPALWLELI